MPTVTALELIEEGYEWIGQLGTGQQMSAEKSARGLRRLIDITEQWNITPAIPWATTEHTFALTDGTVTVGPAADIAVTPAPDYRTVSTSSAFVRYADEDYSVEWIDEGIYRGISDKSITTSQTNFYAWYDATLTVGTIRMWPLPIGGVLHLPLPVAMPTFATLTTEYDLPQGYRVALSQTLGEALSIGLTDLSPALVAAAARSRRLIERTNSSAPVLTGTNAPFSNNGGIDPYTRN